jgi:hypothetical protein
LIIGVGARREAGIGRLGGTAAVWRGYCYYW